MLAALPLQGLAAAGLGACHAGGAPQAVHADSGDGHVHAGHASSVADVANPAQATDTRDAADTAHSCPACANCGHALALPATRSDLAATPLPVPVMAGAVPAVAPGDWPVPDKPPRA